MTCYTAVFFLSLLSLAILCVLVAENDRLSRKEKTPLFLACAVVAASAFAEWLGIRLSGDLSVQPWVIRAVKCADYILTPFAGGALMMQLQGQSIRKKIVQMILVVNAVFQLISAFTGWIVTIDEYNRYTHGPLYVVYILLYGLLILLVFFEFVAYGQRYRRPNRISVYATLLLIVGGILMQEILGGSVRTAYLALTMGLTLLFIHNAEFSQQTADDAIRDQRIHLMLSQIQPHFLFNSLAVIRETYRTDVEKGDKAITQFAEYLRHNMDSMTEDKPIPFMEELKHVRQYLGLQELRFGDELKVVYELGCTDFSLPTLTLQPIVENAVAHGVRKQREHTGIVTIRTVEYENRCEILVSDNGPGFNPDRAAEDDSQSHIGIRNVRERLQQVSGGDLVFHSVPGEGTTVTMILPKGGK